MVNSMNASQSKAETKSDNTPDGFFQSFISHPASVGETYFGHFSYALKFAARLFAAGSAALIHAFIPAWFETTASRQIQKMHSEMNSRHSASQDG